MKNTGTLKVTLPTDTAILMTRVFDAPRHLVWECMTRPDLMKRWLGPCGHELVVCEHDVRPGGQFRNVWHTPEGKVVGFHGEYREIEKPSRVVYTEIFDDYPDTVSVITGTYVEEGGKTTLSVYCEYGTKEVRDIVAATGMEHGAAETYDRLAELLAERLAAA